MVLFYYQISTSVLIRLTTVTRMQTAPTLLDPSSVLVRQDTQEMEKPVQVCVITYSTHALIYFVMSVNSNDRTLSVIKRHISVQNRIEWVFMGMVWLLSSSSDEFKGAPRLLPLPTLNIVICNKPLKHPISGHRPHGVDPLCYFSFQPLLYDWCNKGCGVCYLVSGMVLIKEPLLLIGKSSPCGGSRFPLSLSEWSNAI